jgi:hypothetical protein
MTALVAHECRKVQVSSAWSIYAPWPQTSRPFKHLTGWAIIRRGRNGTICPFFEK